MAAAAMKAEYGPTLGSILGPRWRAAGRPTRIAVRAGALLALLVLVAAALTLENAGYSRGGRVPFSFGYRGLYRTTPEPGGYVRIVQRAPDGSIAYSFAVAPLLLPPYSGELSGELPLYATGYIDALRRRYSAFELRGEGISTVNGRTGYDVLYTASIGGRRYYGRNVLLLPERAGVREGVEIAMLTSSTASKQVRSPQEVATTGILLHPLKTFTFG